jgi:hypothetical protein
MVADVSIQCAGDEYQSIRFTAHAALVVYAFGVLIFFAVLLFACRHAVRDSKPSALSKSIAFLFREYEPWAFWWELAEMIRRLVLIGFFILIPPRGSIKQIAIGAVFCCAFLLLQTQAAPFLTRRDDCLASCCSFTLLIFFICCLLFKVDALQTDHGPVRNGPASYWEQQQATSLSVPTVELSIILLACVRSHVRAHPLVHTSPSPSLRAYSWPPFRPHLSFMTRNSRRSHPLRLFTAASFLPSPSPSRCSSCRLPTSAPTCAEPRR